MIAGNVVARDRILGLVRRNGPGTVKAVMRKVDSERRFLDKLARVPDGTWRERLYLEVAHPGDRGAYRCELSMSKKGDTLMFSDAGTEPSVGALNLTYAGWRGAILAVVGPLLCHDSLFAVGGAARHLRFEPAPGTILSASYPAAVSNGGALGALATVSLANNAVAGMMACDDELRGDLTAPTGLSQWPVTSLDGADQRGEEYSTVILDWYLGTMGAQAFRDGVHTGGVYWGPYHLAPNVEEVELRSPVLYLQRGELRDGQGLGRYQSGAGPTAAWTPHGTEAIVLNVSCCGMASPTALGVSGGYPGIPNFLSVRERTDVRDRMARGELPRPDDLAERRILAPNEKDLVLRPGDVYEGWSSGGAGYGDPLIREPAAVARDVADGYTSAGAAERFYGVALASDGAVDEERTAVLRARIRANRLGRAVDLDALRPPDDELVLLRIGDGLVALDRDGHARFACARCAADLGPTELRAVRRPSPAELVH